RLFGAGLVAFEDDERDLAARLALVIGVAAVHVDHARPEALALLARRDSRPPPLAPPVELDLDVRFGEEVQVPGGMARRAAGGGDEDEPAVIAKVEQRHCPALAALATSRREQQDRRALEPSA